MRLFGRGGSRTAPTFALALLAVAAVHPARVAGQAPQPVEGSSALPLPGQIQSTPLPVFEFHSGFWINLHHFLYEQARLRGSLPVTRNAGAAVAPSATDLNPSKPFSTNEQQAWSAALGYYSREFADRDLLFDGDMILLNDRLGEMESCADLSGRSSATCASGLRTQMIAALEQAAPVYRAHWWPEHDGLNRAWIASVAPQVRHMGANLAQRLASVYHAPWPGGRIRVDVTYYAGPLGAYTSLDPLHITISSSDSRNQGPSALEILFHEASHGLAGAVQQAIARECRARDKPIPRDLWHALLFYTTGEIVQRYLNAPADASGQPVVGGSKPYTPYAVRNGLYSRDWEGYARLLERYWQPYLDGQIDFSTAVARLVAAL